MRSDNNYKMYYTKTLITYLLQHILWIMNGLIKKDNVSTSRSSRKAKEKAFETNLEETQLINKMS